MEFMFAQRTLCIYYGTAYTAEEWQEHIFFIFFAFLPAADRMFTLKQKKKLELNFDEFL